MAGQPRRYYWYKLKNDFFSQITIKKIRRSQNGDTKVIIYLKMILMTIDNDGYIEFKGVEDDICDEIAIALDEESELVKETVEQLKDMGLIEMLEEDFFLPEAKGGVGSECDSAERVRKCRANKKMLQRNNKVTESNEEVTNCNTQVTQRREKENREEKEEIKRDKERDRTGKYLTMFKNNVGSDRVDHDRPPLYTDFDNICKMFNEICKSFKPITDIEKYTNTYSGIFTDCAMKGYQKEDYRIAFNKAENNDYLKGQVEGKTEPSELSWMLERLDRIIGGGYDQH